jgi:lipopolysaccharide biosynthesis glycosyltransferase
VELQVTAEPQPYQEQELHLQPLDIQQELFTFNMQAKNLILTIAYGDHYSKLKDITHPSIQAYADKIGADFISITEKKISATSIHWEKFQIFDLLNTYHRILFIDTDIIIRDDAPNLFEYVCHDTILSL